MTTNLAETTIAHITENHSAIVERANAVRDRLAAVAKVRAHLFSRPTPEEKIAQARAFVARECLTKYYNGLPACDGGYQQLLLMDEWAQEAEAVALAIGA